MRHSMGRMAVALLVVGALAACDTSSPTSPSGELSGTWSGLITGLASSTGALRVTLTQHGAGLAGTFTVTWPDASQNRTGTASGTAIAGVATLALTPATPLSCAGSVTLTGTMTMTLTVGANRLSGSYSSLTCGGALSGNLDLGKE